MADAKAKRAFRRKYFNSACGIVLTYVQARYFIGNYIFRLSEKF